MTAVLRIGEDTDSDRRMVPRADLSLGVRLYRLGDGVVVPANIVNLSVTGFLAELPEGSTIPRHLELELPNAGRREAEAVWRSGLTAGYNFARPLGKADLAAARLASDFVDQPEDEVEFEEAGPSYQLSPEDPIWDVANEARAQEKWSPARRAAVMITAVLAPWATLAGVAAMLA